MDRKKRIKRIGSMVAILVISIVCVSYFVSLGMKAYANHTLPGIETIVANNGTYKPFTILEVVDSKANASLGYLVGGEEPVSNGKSLADMPAENERAAKMGAFLVDTSVASAYRSLFGRALTYDTFVEATAAATKNVSFTGHFTAQIGGDYNLISTEATYVPYDAADVTQIGLPRYEKYAEFSIVAGGGYRPTFKLLDLSSASIPAVLVGGVTYPNYSKFEIDETKSAVVVDVAADLTAYNGNLLFDNYAGGYSYFGKIVVQAVASEPTTYILGADGIKYVYGNTVPWAGLGYNEMPLAAGAFKIINFTENEAAGSYYISDVTDVGVGNSEYLAEILYHVKDTGAFVKTDNGEEHYEYVAGAGAYIWNTNYSETTIESISYSGGFTNQEWVKKNVFDRADSEIASLIIDVRTVTMDELNTTDLDAVSMIYFAGVSSNYAQDITDTKAISIFRNMTNNNLPILLNRSVCERVIDNASLPNMSKLCILLMQNSYAAVATSTLETDWVNGTKWTNLKTTMRVENVNYGYNYVNQACYIYDDTAYGIGDLIPATPFVATNFLDAFTTAFTAQGFSLVLGEIQSENFYLDVGGYTERISEDVSKATALRYIINYGYKRNIIKSSISVLEIQPCNSFTYTDTQLLSVNTLNNAVQGLSGTANQTFTLETSPRNTLTVDYIAQNFAKQFINNTDRISLKSMSTGEFIGKIEDLNENYDLIYVGLDTSTMNTYLNRGTTYTTTKPRYIKTADQTLYNNSYLNGLIYLHAGDYIQSTSTTNFGGLMSPNNLALESSTVGYGYIAFSGNDITLEKYNNLKEYIDAGYPVIFDDGFYNISGSTVTVNSNKIDSASYMYKIAKYAIDSGYFGKNVNTKGNIQADTTGTGASATLTKYLNLSKLSISPTILPVEYDGTKTHPDYLVAVNGKYTLTYEFLLKNDSAASIIDTKYDVNLFIDTSVDGRYSVDEEIGSLQVYELKNGSYVQIYLNTSGNFELLAGHYYRVTREVPTGYLGLLPWKLVFTQNDNSLVRRSVLGFTAVPIETADRQSIKVLQLLSSSGNNWDLSNDTKFAGYLDKVQEFDINIDTMLSTNYIKAITNLSSGTVVTDADVAKYTNLLNDYDMLVIGFSDTYGFSGGTDKQREAAAKAIRQYISDGRSVLFTHDTTSYHNIINDGWGYEFNRYVRDIAGQDRYGVLRRIDGLSVIDTVYDTMWAARGSQSATALTYNYIQGFTNAHIARYASTNNYLPSTRAAYRSAGLGSYSGQTIYVSEVNSGQVTRYPFYIPASFSVATTHPQYYQLDLDTNSKDTILDDDVVVWYCLSDVDGSSFDDCYQAMPNDVRNDYYIYNKGNVTYSGVGHSKVTNDIEMQLFVNTMVAAYNAGLHAPKVVYKEGTEQNAATIDYIYLPYDEAIGTYIDNTADIYFDVSDSSFTQGTKTINAYYYLQVTAGTTGAVRTNVNGENIYLLEFLPTKVTTVGTGATLANKNVVANDSRYLITLTTDFLKLGTNNNMNVYIGAKTTYTRTLGVGNVTTAETTMGYYRVGVVRTQLFDLE